MNIQRKNSAHHFRMQSEREQTLVQLFPNCTQMRAIIYTYIPSNTFTPVEERVLNRIKYYPRS